jgi:hypothetical protein
VGRGLPHLTQIIKKIICYKKTLNVKVLFSRASEISVNPEGIGPS